MIKQPLSTITGIDTHAHIFEQNLPMVQGRRYSPAYDALVEHYISHLDRNGLSGGVLVQPSFLGKDNHYMLDALKRYPKRLRGIAVVDRTISAEALDDLAQRGVVGIRLNLVGKTLDDYAEPDWQAFFEKLAERGLQVEIQRSFDDFSHFLPAMLTCGVTVVIDHFGLPAGGIDLQKPAHRLLLGMLDNAQLWVKLSASYRSALDEAQRQEAFVQLRKACGGIERFLWGSDWPHTQFEDRTDFDAQYALLRALILDETERNQVLINNPAGLFRFV
jgi:predicted TIM-barrel fold metal-dependent hydrolase